MSVLPPPSHKEYPPSRFSPLPAGWYRAEIEEAVNEKMKSGNGEAVKVVLNIASDGYRGRKAFLRINARHTNPTTEGIGQRQIDSLLEATGFTRSTLQGYPQLQRKPVLVKLKIKPGQNGYNDDNDLVTFAKPDAAHQLVPPPSRIGGAPAATGSPAPAAASTPWANGGQASPSSAAPAEQQQAAQQPAQAASSGSVPPWKR